MTQRESLENEFGRYTEWMVEAAASLQVRDLIPVGCRGTGDPLLLEELADAIGARLGMKVLDVGCGMGGPAAWLRARHGCETVGIDLMVQNVRASRRLYGHSVACVASTSDLPFADATFDAVWAVGVMEMIDDKPRAFAEIKRVLKPGGSSAVYSFTKRSEALPDPPLSNHFEFGAALVEIIRTAGLGVVEARPAAAGGVPPVDWRVPRERVARAVRERHGDDDGFKLVRDELERFNRLRSSGEIEAWHFRLEKTRS